MKKVIVFTLSLVLIIQPVMLSEVVNTMVWNEVEMIEGGF